MSDDGHDEIQNEIGDIITSAVNANPDEFEIEWTTVGDEPVVTVTSTSVKRHSLNVRIQSSGLLLVDVDQSQALEISFGDVQDMRDFRAIVQSFCDGSLEVLRGIDGRYYGLRGSDFQLSVSSSIPRLFRSRPRKWTVLRTVTHE